MDVFEVVADPTRRAVLELLADGERSAGELVDLFPSLTQPAISRHLRILREAELVAVRPQAQRRVYTLRPERLAEIDAWVSRYRPFWAERLDALQEHLTDVHPATEPPTERNDRP